MANFTNPATAAMPYLQDIPGKVNPYYKPYIDRGQRTGANLEDQYGQLTNNTGDVYNKLGAGYKESPGYQFKLHQALMAGDNAAAAGGMAGSNMHQQNNMQIGNDIASQDFNNYMQNIMGLYGTGLNGEGHMNDQGYDANNEMGQTVGNNLNSEASMKYAGTNLNNEYNQERQRQRSQMWGTIGGLAGGVAGTVLGPAGSVVGNKIGEWAGSKL